jgi:hypothetical protein
LSGANGVVLDRQASYQLVERGGIFGGMRGAFF